MLCQHLKSNRDVKFPKKNETMGRGTFLRGGTGGKIEQYANT